MSAAAILTPNDSRVLQALFDSSTQPSSSSSSSPSPSASCSIPTDATLPPLPHIPTAIVPALRAAEAAALRPLHADEHPSAAALGAAIDQLTALIDAHPTYASAYANRAQARRLLYGDGDNVDNPNPAVLDDLRTAIRLASATSAFPSAPISPLQRTLLGTAHTHLGYLLWMQAGARRRRRRDAAAPMALQEEDEKDEEDEEAEALEAQAHAAFAAAAGRYGDGRARDLAVRTNPYARLCGRIVTGALRGEMVGMEVGIRREWV